MPYAKVLLSFIYAVSTLSAVLAIFMIFDKTIQMGSPVLWLAVCLVTQILFAIAALAEIRNSQYLSEEQKAKWKRWLLWSPLFYGFFYLKHFRK